MYIPRVNKEERVPVLHKLMENQPFASLITMGSSGLFASHIPMVLEQKGALGRLRGHISRANTQWRDYTPSVEALAIFSGPQHYITPIVVSGKEGDAAKSCLPGTMWLCMPMGT